MRRWLLVGVLTVAALGAVYLLRIRSSTIEPHLTVVSPTAVIGEGNEAVGVSASGHLLDWQPPPEGLLPSLPLSTPPKGGRLAGPMLQQALVLGAAPAALRPCISGSYYGTSGVDVELRSGIELRFGDASGAAKKWASAVAVLAEPTVTALDYVNVHSPRHPAIGGSGHALPPPSEVSGAGCGE